MKLLQTFANTAIIIATTQSPTAIVNASLRGANIDANDAPRIEGEDELSSRRDPHRELMTRQYRMFKEGAISDSSEDEQLSAAPNHVGTIDLSSSLEEDNLFEPPSQVNQLKKDPRIIGGTNAGQFEFPFSVSMQDNIGHFCGGSLITPNMVLTAAHCLGGNYDVVYGKTNLNSSTGQTIPMKREIEYKGYKPSSTDGDYALLILDESVNDPSIIKPNSNSNYPPNGESVTVMGWGDTNLSDWDSDLSSKLMKVTVNVITNEVCGQSSDGRDDYYGQITNNMLCARVQGGGKDACQGDSGGPLVGTNDDGDLVQVGVVSWGIGCAEAAFPGVYSRVSRVWDWIEEEVCANSASPIPEHYNCGQGGGSTPPPPTPRPTPRPTPNPVNGGPPPTPRPTGAAENPGNWMTVVEDDFTGNFADRASKKQNWFKPSGKNGANPADVKIQQSFKFRKGVLNIQHEGAAEVEPVNVSSYNTCMAEVDFNMLRFKSSGDRWCIEKSTNGGSSYKSIECNTCNNKTRCKQWHTANTTFSVKGNKTVQVRLKMYGEDNKRDLHVDNFILRCK